MLLYAFVASLAVLQLVLPLRWSFVPLVVAALHLGNVEILPELTPCRILIVLGLVRSIFGVGLASAVRTNVGRAMVAFAAVVFLVSLVPREDVPSPFRSNVGLVLNVVGTFVYGLAPLGAAGALNRLAVVLCIAVVPLGIGLGFEKATRQNAYTSLGSYRSEANVRKGRVRAQGPFKHSILAGTAGAVIMPFAVLLWQRRRRIALVSLVACIATVISSGSSGPLAAFGAALGGILLWPRRALLWQLRWWFVALLGVLHLLSNRGVWYLMDRIDLVGGSTGWHRAKLIDSAIEHLGEWWLAGTDFTRHWMPTGVTWSERHSDLTNYYIHLGVVGGVGLVACLLAALFYCFSTLRWAIGGAVEGGAARREVVGVGEQPPTGFELWCLACGVTAHAVSFLSISYFDQMYVLFYLPLAYVANLEWSLRKHLMSGAAPPGQWEAADDAGVAVALCER